MSVFIPHARVPAGLRHTLGASAYLHSPPLARRMLLNIAALGLLVAPHRVSVNHAASAQMGLYDLSATRIDGATVAMSDFKGTPLVVVVRTPCLLRVGAPRSCTRAGRKAGPRLGSARLGRSEPATKPVSRACFRQNTGHK